MRAITIFAMILTAALATTALAAPNQGHLLKNEVKSAGNFLSDSDLQNLVHLRTSLANSLKMRVGVAEGGEDFQEIIDLITDFIKEVVTMYENSILAVLIATVDELPQTIQVKEVLARAIVIIEGYVTDFIELSPGFTEEEARNFILVRLQDSLSVVIAFFVKTKESCDFLVALLEPELDLYLNVFYIEVRDFALIPFLERLYELLYPEVTESPVNAVNLGGWSPPGPGRQSMIGDVVHLIQGKFSRASAA